MMTIVIIHGVVIKHDNAIWRKRGGIGQSAGHRGVLSAGWRSFGEMGKRGEMESGESRGSAENGHWGTAHQVLKS